MSPLPFTAATVFRPAEGVAARAVGAIPCRTGTRVVLQDTTEAHWVVELDAAGRLTEVLAGPVTAEQALHAAELVVSGVPDHHSVAGLAATVFRPAEGVAARAVGAIPCRTGTRVVLQDTTEAHWVVELDAAGRLTEVLAGPVTAEQALHAAELVVSGVPDHHSVAGLVNILAIGLVMRALADGRAA